VEKHVTKIYISEIFINMNVFSMFLLCRIFVLVIIIKAVMRVVRRISGCLN